MIDQAIAELAPVVGTTAACAAVGRGRATHDRWHPKGPPRPRPAPKPPRPQPRALSEAERRGCSRCCAPSASWTWRRRRATLLDEGVYLASAPTMYRILRSVDEVQERRRQAVHPAYLKPELMAEWPNQVWSWDITKLFGPEKWTYYYLYVLDIFSRYVVGWMLAMRESASLAERLLADSICKQGVERDQLTIHADRGSSMSSKPVALLLSDLGVTKSHSRPHCSNDNLYSEAQFKTLKYRPEFPDRFGSAQDARAFSKRCFGWYNDDHRHSGIGHHTPADVHHGCAGKVREAPRGPPRRPCGALRALRPRATAAAPTARPGLDQPAHPRRGDPAVNTRMADLDRQPSRPVGNGSSNGAEPRSCLVCDLLTRGRSAYCSDAHRVRAHRLRNRQQL
jgi:putative transposase